MNRLGSFLKERRLGLALTQSEFAEKIGITSVTLSKIENGEHIGIQVIKKISEFTNISSKVLREMMLYDISDSV